jgi:hypothetical protein
MPTNSWKCRPVVARTFVKHMRAYFAEKNAIKRDQIAGHAAFLLEPYQSPRERRLRLPDVYEMFEQMKIMHRMVD